MVARIESECLLQDVNEVGDIVGGRPTRKQYDRHGRYGSSTIEKRFGGWNAALDESSVDNHNGNLKDPILANKSWLYGRYWGEGRTLAGVSDEIGCSRETVRSALVRLGIPRREKGGFDRRECWQLYDEDWLSEKYIDEGLSQESIADIIGCCWRVVADQLEKFNISRSEMEYRKKSWLEKQYENKTMDEIASGAGVTKGTISYWCRKYGLDTSLKRREKFTCACCGEVEERTPSEADIRIYCCSDCMYNDLSGENSHLWEGGSPTYYGESWTRQRWRALDRDGSKCVSCGDGEEKLGRRPDVHHIIPFKEYGVGNHEKANELKNLVCLCRKCHLQWEGIPLKPQVER